MVRSFFPVTEWSINVLNLKNDSLKQMYPFVKIVSHNIHVSESQLIRLPWSRPCRTCPQDILWLSLRYRTPLEGNATPVVTALLWKCTVASKRLLICFLLMEVTALKPGCTVILIIKFADLSFRDSIMNFLWIHFVFKWKYRRFKTSLPCWKTVLQIWTTWCKI